MLRFAWYLPAAACALAVLVMVGVSAPWRDAAASLLVLLACLASIAVALHAQAFPSFRRTDFWQASSLAAAALIAISAGASANVQRALWGFAFDLTSMSLLLACIALALLLTRWPSRARLVILFVAAAATALLWVAPHWRSAPEVRPSLAATLSVAFSAAAELGPRQMIIGSGPNSFVYLWPRYAPESVGKSSFATERFPVGSGLLPTLIAEIGIVAVLMLALSFLERSARLGHSLVAEYRARPSAAAERLLHAAAPLFGLAALFFAPPSAALLLSAFCLLGAAGHDAGAALPASRVRRYASRAGIALCIAVALGAMYLAVASALYFRAASLFTSGDLIRARNAAERSHVLSGDPQTARLAASILRTLAHETARHKAVKDVPPLYADAISYMRAATVREPAFADNWSLFGVIAAEQYSATRDGSFFEISRGALEQARKLAPNDARVPLFQGQLYLLAGRRDEGVAYLKESLAMRPDLADAKALLDSALGTVGR